MIPEYQTPEKALAYLARADTIPNRTHGERMVLDLLPAHLDRVLDLGCGDGRLLALVKLAYPTVAGIALDFSPTMLEQARLRFAGDMHVAVVAHDFAEPLPDRGKFDAVVSSFAIHHVEDSRKRGLYKEVFALLEPGGVFINLEHVASPSERLHDDFLDATAMTRNTEDQSNRCTAVSAQLAWLEGIGFQDVDCFWKWRELAVLAGTKPS